MDNRIHNGQRRPVVKICGITRAADAELAVSLGVQRLGFIFAAGSARSVAPEHAGQIDTESAERVGVFVSSDLDAILDIVKIARLDYVQLHGNQSCAFCAGLADNLGRERIIRTFWPETYATREALETAIESFDEWAGSILLDAGADGGGSGRVLDWPSLGGLPYRWILAGGLRADNIGEALALCAPWGVEFNSGIEQAPGEKDEQALRRAIRAVETAQSASSDGGSKR